MQELFDRILTINLVCSTVVFYTAARLYVLPRLSGWKPRSILLPILLAFVAPPRADVPHTRGYLYRHPHAIHLSGGGGRLACGCARVCIACGGGRRSQGGADVGLDWQRTVYPARWRLMDRERTYDWVGVDGAGPP